MSEPASQRPSMPEWYYVFRGQRQGPFDEEQFETLIAGGQIRSDTLVWVEGMTEWLAAGSVARWAQQMENAARAGITEAPPVAPGPIMLPGAEFVPTGYGGFWIRVVAYIIDVIVLSVGEVVISSIMGITMGVFGAGFRGSAASGLGELSLLMISCVMYILPLMGAWAYFALMESSRHQGTLGKMAMGMRVTTLRGERISLGRATGRFAGRIISGLILGIGYIMVAFTEKKQGLHDLIAGTLVIKGNR
ncbi:MAG: RDD family protein [Phycisphaerae bacterium]|nr:RDD family protein [Phycisphaerae bacterium]